MTPVATWKPARDLPPGRRFLIAVGVLLVVGSGACTSSSPTNEASPGAPGTSTTAGPVAPPGPAACRSGDPLADVYHPDRLEVRRACVTVTGIVRSVRREDDGDVDFDLALDASYRSRLTPANAAEQHGWLVVEIVPADEPGCTPGRPPRPATGSYDYGICTGSDETPPPVGAHVSVTGPYVLDEDHGGWAEVHPAWAIATTPG